MDTDADLAFALQLQFQEEELDDGNFESPQKASCSHSKPASIVDDCWEYLDPNPNIHGLFLEFNAQYFWGKLEGVEVKWAPRMTLNAGVCSYEGRGGLCTIRLSQPLLKLRPRSDLVETLLHEMIHAYLFVTYNNKDHSAHGPEFCKHMKRLNSETGANVTIYHNFIDEVNSYRQHWWKCDGPCQKERPHFGLVKRSMNRAPGSYDWWWAEHKAKCGGNFVKVKEPENYKPSRKRKIDEGQTLKTSKIENGASSSGSSFVPFGGKGHVLGAPKHNPTASKVKSPVKRIPANASSGNIAGNYRQGTLFNFVTRKPS